MLISLKVELRWWVNDKICNSRSFTRVFDWPAIPPVGAEISIHSSRPGEDGAELEVSRIIFFVEWEDSGLIDVVCNHLLMGNWKSKSPSSKSEIEDDCQWMLSMGFTDDEDEYRKRKGIPARADGHKRPIAAPLRDAPLRRGHCANPCSPPVMLDSI